MTGENTSLSVTEDMLVGYIISMACVADHKPKEMSFLGLVIQV